MLRAAFVIDVTADTLADLIDDNDYVVALFYSGHNIKTSTAVKHLEAIQIASKQEIPFAKIDDNEEATAYGLEPSKLPGLVLFDNGIPEQFKAELNNESQLKKWLKEEIRSNDIDVIDTKVLRTVVKRTPSLVLLFVDASHEVPNEDHILVLCDSFDIAVAKLEGKEAAAGGSSTCIP